MERDTEVKILTDNIEKDLGYEFELYSKTIKHIITNSDPQFTIGIYGEWGTGKTTLMNGIQTQFLLQNVYDKNAGSSDKILKKVSRVIPWPVKNNSKLDNDFLEEEFPTVWFNAWRYEREETKATVPLMVTIIQRLGFEIDKSKKTISKLKIEAINFLKSCEYHFGIQLPGINLGLTYRPSKNEKLPIPTTQKGIDIIERMLKQLFLHKPKFRVIVFIDDLDRCSPEKALEVLESVKILLNVKGIVYVLGLSHKTLAKMISKQYEFGDERGEQYIRKIIQIPINVPVWNTTDIESLIENRIHSELNDEYSTFVRTYKHLIAIAVEANPREVKRFINNIIISLEVYPNKETITKEGLLVIEAIKVRWNDFYQVFMNDIPFRKLVLSKIEDTQDTKSNKIKRVTKEAAQITSKMMNLPLEIQDSDIPEEFREQFSTISNSLWKFLKYKDVSAIILSIKEWEEYRHATESVDENRNETKYNDPDDNSSNYDDFSNYDDLDPAPFIQLGADPETV